MKHFIAIIIFLVVLQGYSQTSVKVQPYSAASLNQYLWTFSKNNATPGEKGRIDFDAMDNWQQLGYYLSVSDDGGYFAYTINKPHPVLRTALNMFGKQDSLVVQSTKSTWRKAIPCESQGFFSADAKQYVFRNGNSLFILQLGTDVSKEIKGLGSFKCNEKNNWVAWQSKQNDSLTLRNLLTGRENKFTAITNYDFDSNSDYFVCQNKNADLILFSLRTNQEKRFANVTTYVFPASGNALLLKTGNGVDASLQLVTLPEGRVTTIFATKGKQTIGDYRLDKEGEQVLFNMTDSGNAGKTGIWYYKRGMEEAVLKLNNEVSENPKGQVIGQGVSFADNGRYFQFSLKELPARKETPSEELAGVEVWNYKDVNLQSVQSKQGNDVPRYRAIANIENGKVIFCESSNRKLAQSKGDYAIVRTDYRDIVGDRFWERKSYEDSIWIVSLKDGSSRLLPASDASKLCFSPDGNWLIYFDARNGCHYYSYNLTSGEVKNITVSVPNNQLAINNTDGNNSGKNGNLAAWIDGSTFVIVYDSYDLWKLDLTGRQPALNITKGLGQANNIVFNLFATDRYSGGIPTIQANDGLVLRAFSRINKQNGFYKKANVDAAAPAPLQMGDYFMSLITGCHDLNLSNFGMPPMKAKKDNIWIVQRQSATDAPNYYQTTDFNNFRKLTNLQPQAQYQWLKQELHSFKYLDGATGQGILYKPENFDPTKKYPVLIAFYGDFSDNMHQFRTPVYYDQSMAAGKSPMWLLNNGFLVFTPDIAVTPLKYGLKAYSCIEGAAEYLQHLPYVDAGKLGFASHSFSAQLGAYLFTHSTTFSAAAITEGFSFGDVISQALSLKGGESKLQGAEQEREGGNFWENKAAWLDQTTVLNVDKAKAALLLLCNKESSEDYQDQATQFFIAMRRLNKSAWWLKYDNGDHTLSYVNEQKDYTVRYTQFFDHFLNDAPAPRWMTQGIPNKLKGLENRYELDASNSCGKECLVCMAWNKQFNRTPEMFRKEIVTWTLDKDIAAELEGKQNDRRKQLDKEGEIRTAEVMKTLNNK